MSKPPAAKKVKLSLDEATSVIHSYCASMTRPYSAGDIYTNTKNPISKTKVTEMLDQLVTEGKLLSKMCGKSAIYYPIEDENLPDQKELEEKQAKLKKSIIDLKGKCKELRPPAKISKKEAEERLVQVKESVQALNDRLAQSGDVVDLKTKNDLDSRHAIALKSFKTRRKWFYEAFKTITENMPNEKTLLEEIGVETDESVGFVL
jgi:hypothetical protein